MHKNFELKVLATNWGYKGSVDQYCAHVKKEGYDGIEIWWPLDKQQQDEMFAALKKYQLEVGFLAAGDQPDFRDHLDHFKQMIGAAAHNTVQRPIYINCHSGRDFFSFEQNQAFIDHTLSLSAETGILILHETHRSSVSLTSSLANPSSPSCPEIARRNVLARPRVTCCSSFVTR